MTATWMRSLEPTMAPYDVALNPIPPIVIPAAPITPTPDLINFLRFWSFAFIGCSHSSVRGIGGLLASKGPGQRPFGYADSIAGAHLRQHFSRTEEAVPTRHDDERVPTQNQLETAAKHVG